MSNRNIQIITASWMQYKDQLRQIRKQVFVIEQQVPIELEWDGLDETAQHFLATTGNAVPIGCARLLPDGHLGRVAVISEWRRCGVGSKLVAAAISFVQQNSSNSCIELSSQLHACNFYAKFGFTLQGSSYIEAGIPHQLMRLCISDE